MSVLYSAKLHISYLNKNNKYTDDLVSIKSTSSYLTTDNETQIKIALITGDDAAG